MSDITPKRNQSKKLLGGLLIGIILLLLTSSLDFRPITLANNTYSQCGDRGNGNGEDGENNIWRNQGFLSFFGGLIGAVISGGVVIYINRQDLKSRKRERLIESLTWFEGKTQKRNVGIAIVESEWDCPENKDFHLIWTSLLVNQAIYLLTNEKDEIAFHEEQNLCRIIDILVEKAELQKKAKNNGDESKFYRARYDFLVLAIENHVDNTKEKKIKHLKERINKLKKHQENWVTLIDNKELINDEILFKKLNKFIGNENS